MTGTRKPMFSSENSFSWLVKIPEELAVRIENLIELLPKIYSFEHPELTRMRVGKGVALRVALEKGVEKIEADAVEAGLMEYPE